MKKILFSMLLLAGYSASAFSQVYSSVVECKYYGEKDVLYAYSVPGKIMVKKTHGFTQNDFEEKLKAIGGETGISWYNPDVCTIFIELEKINEAYDLLIKDDSIESVRNVMSNGNPAYYSEFGITDEIVVGWNVGQMTEEIKDSIKSQYGIRLKPDASVFEGCEIWLIDKNDDMFEIIRCLKETGYFTAVQPGPYTHVQYFDGKPSNTFVPEYYLTKVPVLLDNDFQESVCYDILGRKLNNSDNNGIIISKGRKIMFGPQQ